MSDPQETPEQERTRLVKEVANLRRARAALPAVILKPYADEALAHVREELTKATQVTVPTVPGPSVTTPGTTVTTVADPGLLLAVSKCRGVTKDMDRWTECSLFDRNHNGMVDMEDFNTIAKGQTGIVVSASPGAAHSPPEYEVTILTEYGRLITVPASQVSEKGIAPAPGPGAGAKPAIGPGTRVRDKPTGKTGYVSEVADNKAIVALDEGGFITRDLSDLEPV